MNKETKQIEKLMNKETLTTLEQKQLNLLIDKVVHKEEE